MSLELWKPLKIKNPLLENIFKLPIDGKVLNNGKIQAHPLIIFENSLDKTYYCIRLQTANDSTIKSNIPIDNCSYQKLSYWNKIREVAVTKDIFIIDKELLENNIDKAIYQDTSVLNKNDKSLIVDDLSRRINAIPPDLNIIRISNNLKHNLVLYTTPDLINNQLLSTLSNANKRINANTKNYYKHNFSKSQFLTNTNALNSIHTQQALKTLKIAIDKELGILHSSNDFDYLFDPQTNTYVFHLIPSSLSDFDKTPTDLKDSKVINEYNKSHSQSNQNKTLESKKINRCI
ncbi:Mbov_0400 family ICE element protein [Metamycoplasma hominis]